VPAFLEWQELLVEADRMRPAALIAPQQQVLVADAAAQFFRDIFATIDAAPVLRGKDDRKIMVFNQIIDHARRDGDGAIESACRNAGLRMRSIRRLLDTIGWYRRKIESQEFSGAAVARGYRSFLIQPGGHGGHRFFTGESQARSYRAGGVLRYRNVARYFTPTEVIQQMVKLARPSAHERVIDMTCGTGGYLAECVEYVSKANGERLGQQFLTTRIVGIDDDPFCTSCTRALLTFLNPQLAGRFQVFLHNALYRRAPKISEIDEDPTAEAHLHAGSYDLVIGNPPGNDEYSGTNREEIARQWEKRFGQTDGGLMDHHCFVRRAIELAKPNGGRICVLLPEGFLTRDNRGMPSLRAEVAQGCEVRLIITLPRVFKDNNARMAIVYLVRSARPKSQAKVFLSEVRERWFDAEKTEQVTDLWGEIEGVVGNYLGA
jgi:hypothetical protein